MKLRGGLAGVAAAVLLGTAGAVAVTATPAWADSGDYGIAWDAQPTLPDQWFSAGGRDAEIVRNGTGRYSVIFHGRADSGGNAEVMAIASDGRFCQIQGWYPVGADERVDVLCFAADGTPADSEYQVTFLSRSGTGGMPFTYLWANSPTTTGPYTAPPSYAYDSTGVAPMVRRESTGRYWVFLPASRKLGWVTPESVQATAYGSTPAHCQVDSIMHTDGWQSVDCRAVSGALLDTTFSLAFGVKRSALGGAGANWSYGWVDGTVSAPGTSGPATPLYGYAADGRTGSAAIAATQLDTGHYQVKLYAVATSDEPFVNVYATNDDEAYCSATQWSTAGTTELVEVWCLGTATHAPQQSPFFINFVMLAH